MISTSICGIGTWEGESFMGEDNAKFFFTMLDTHTLKLKPNTQCLREHSCH